MNNPHECVVSSFSGDHLSSLILEIFSMVAIEAIANISILMVLLKNMEELLMLFSASAHFLQANTSPLLICVTKFPPVNIC
jgi:hypothetical protein